MGLYRDSTGIVVEYSITEVEDRGASNNFNSEKIAKSTGVACGDVASKIDPYPPPVLYRYCRNRYCNPVLQIPDCGKGGNGAVMAQTPSNDGTH
jgi:hypothetical protein